MFGEWVPRTLVHNHWNNAGERRKMEGHGQVQYSVLFISYYLDLETLENHCSSLFFFYLSGSHSQSYSVNKTLTSFFYLSQPLFLIYFLLKKAWVCPLISNDVSIPYCCVSVLNLSLVPSHRKIIIHNMLFLQFQSFHSLMYHLCITNICLPLCVLGVVVLDYRWGVILHHSIYHCVPKQ